MPLDNKCRIGPLAGAPPDRWSSSLRLNRDSSLKMTRLQSVTLLPDVGKNPVDTAYDVGSVVILADVGSSSQLRNRFSHSSLDPNFLSHSGSFAMREKGGNRLVSGLDYMVNALKLHNQAATGSGESLQKCVAWRCPDGTQHLFCWPILAISGQSLASNDPVVDSRDLNLVFGHVEATHNYSFPVPPNTQ
ncbi:hypothetical protein TNCV_1787671 [Trichonephila clavipes]|nr:hypothetical protein TNCV_1787671 [Trichonephila clavipes]